MKQTLRFSQEFLLLNSASGNMQALQKFSIEQLGSNARDVEGNTPLILAVENNRLHVVKLLLDAGADITCTNNSGFDALTLSVQEGFLPITRLLLKFGNFPDGVYSAANNALNRLEPSKNSKIMSRLLWEFEEHEVFDEFPTDGQIQKVCKLIAHCVVLLIQVSAREDVNRNHHSLLECISHSHNTDGTSVNSLVPASLIQDERMATINSILSLAMDAKINPVLNHLDYKRLDWEDVISLMITAPMQCLYLIHHMLSVGKDINRHSELGKSALMHALGYRESAFEMVQNILDVEDNATPDTYGCFPSDYAMLFAASGRCGNRMYLGKAKIIKSFGKTRQ